MRRIKWFQRFAILLLLGINAFVFLSMRDEEIRENLIYSVGMIGLTLIALSLITLYRNTRKKKTMTDQS